MLGRQLFVRGSRMAFSSQRNASCLVIAEHDSTTVSQGTLSAVTAASKIGDVTVLVTGSNIDDAVKSAASVDGVKTVLAADHEV